VEEKRKKMLAMQNIVVAATFFVFQANGFSLLFKARDITFL
jgi:hypothetical protein